MVAHSFVKRSCLSNIEVTVSDIRYFIDARNRIVPIALTDMLKPLLYIHNLLTLKVSLTEFCHLRRMPLGQEFYGIQLGRNCITSLDLSYTYHSF